MSSRVAAMTASRVRVWAIARSFAQSTSSPPTAAGSRQAPGHKVTGRAAAVGSEATALAHQREQRLGRKRPRDVEALGRVAPQVAQLVHLFGCLDALGDG